MPTPCPARPTLFGLQRRSLLAAVGLVLLAACGGGEPEVVLTIDGQPTRSTQLPSIILNGASFVPAGSSCPNTGAFAVTGTLGPHSIGWTRTSTDATTGASTSSSGAAQATVWTCNSQDGRVMHWTSDVIVLQPGANLITVTMTAGTRSSSASVTVTRE